MAAAASSAAAGDKRAKSSGGGGGTSSPSSMLYSFLLFVITLSLQQMYRDKLASSEISTIFGGFISSLLFLLALTMIGNFQELAGSRTGWGAVLVAELVACIAAGTIHRVCITTLSVEYDATLFSMQLPLLASPCLRSEQAIFEGAAADAKKKLH